MTLSSKSIRWCVMLVAAAIAVSIRAQTTTPPTTGPSSLEVRAQEEFSRGNWASALPLLRKVESQLADQPDRLGPIQENIRVCEKNLKLAAGTTAVAMAPDAAAAGAATAPPKGAAGLDPSTGSKRVVHPAAKSGETLDIAIKELGNFDYDADRGGNIPADVQQLSGTSVRMRGFMIPMDQAQSITEFALVPSLFSCCYGQPPQVQHTIVVHAPKGKAVSYFPDEISVEGKLLVQEKKEDGFIVSIFELDCTSVKPAPK